MSNRGLTFSFQANDTFRAGTRYRYIVDNKLSEVIIIPDENGKYKLSKKGANAKPLVDLRNEEIKSVMSMARYMEVEILNDKIIVHIVKANINTDTLSEYELTDLIEKSDKITFSIDKFQLERDYSALSEMLTASGLFSAKTRSDISYVFDTVSLFSGAGLLDYPFKKDDSFDLKFAVDFDKAACETYKNNIGDHILCMDIRDLDEKDVPETELIIGGPCCQGYSNANRAGNTEQNVFKRLLVDDYIRIVKAKKPLMFVIENVRQFITKENGKYLDKVFSELSSDYNITYSVVNDVEVGGYSKRERMVLIGSCKAMGKVIIPNVELARHKTVGNALKKVTSDWFNYNDITKASEETKKKMVQVRPGHNYKDIAEMTHLDRHSNVYRRLSADEPSVTITNWRKVNLMPPVGNRILSVSEAAAIMGLDKNFKFFGSINDRQQQVGNGVTQAIASFVKSIVKNALYGYANSLLMPQTAIT
ncbi:DNA cytosine methyltransferase [Butyrivibrio sp.]|uniref:DNA cytosine methyltransferase n=1 Tax=Butyrivibrio sp. TaxID=28121 RepID=UPI0025C421C1|nr:DNA cytosine methyltransferase [Butyrivibrio sp.]MBQ9303323.1 DNA cytosine methyltransferase [Butyrivibrio sp.]